ncbi:hypothetical protein E1B28_009687 [Marasmius oreades]|nr:uncharacterized protein E1B28_009687 [Marasmius oreades]KAG7090580.1 hypothetical protein E1B28_009687 [Marasmius oreades]
MEYLAHLIEIYSVSLSFSLAILWCSRASLSLSLARILPPGRHRTFSIIYAVSSLLIGCAFIIAYNTACTWKRITNVLSPGLLRCSGGGTLFGITTASGLTSALILVALPLHCLWHITTDLPKSERRLILTLFTSSFLTFIVCLVHAVYIVKRNSFAITFSSKLEASISLIVCNSVVVVPNLYTLFFRRHAHAEEGDQSGSSYVRTGPTTPVHDTTSQTAKPDHSDTYNFELTRISDVNLSFSSDPDFVQHTSTRVDDVEVRTMPQG